MLKLIKDQYLLEAKKEADLRQLSEGSESLIKVSFICDFLCVSESTKGRRPQVLADGRYADGRRVSAEDQGGRLINSACRQG